MPNRVRKKKFYAYIAPKFFENTYVSKKGIILSTKVLLRSKGISILLT